MADFLGYALKLVAQVVKPGLEGLFDSTPNEFDSFDDVFKLYEGGIELPHGPLVDNIRGKIPLQMLKEIFRTDGENLFEFPMPQVIEGLN
jgi:linoleate 9S-lipoxygenase